MHILIVVLSGCYQGVCYVKHVPCNNIHLKILFHVIIILFSWKIRVVCCIYQKMFLKFWKPLKWFPKLGVNGKDFQVPKIMQKSKLNLKSRNMAYGHCLKCLLLYRAISIMRWLSKIFIPTKFMKIKLLKYGQNFTEMTKKKGKSGITQKLAYGYG